MAPVLVNLESAVSASRACAQNPPNRTSTGPTLDHAGTFSVEHTESGVVAVSQDERSSPCVGWGSSDRVAEGVMPGGQWFLLVVELQLNTVSKSVHTYILSEVNGVGPVLQPIEFTITNSTVVDSTGNFCRDLGSSFGVPLAFTVTASDA